MTASRGRARFGLLVPFTNTNFEPDMALLSPKGVTLHAARLGGYDEGAIPDASQMRGLGASDIDEPLRLLKGARPDIVLYGCTSATLAHGPRFDQALAERIGADSGARTVTAAGAIVFALQTLGVSRIGFASPYVSEINHMAIGFLAEMGYETLARSGVSEVLDNEGQGALTPEAVFDLAVKADHPGAEAIVLSCTDMRSVETLARLEAQLDKPVISSNQAMVFQALSMLDIQDKISGYGALLERARPRAVQPETT